MTRVRSQSGECPLCGVAWGSCPHADPAEFGVYELPLCPCAEDFCPCAAEMEG